jgi:hypothetical protein
VVELLLQHGAGQNAEALKDIINMEITQRHPSVVDILEAHWQKMVL